MQAYSADEVSMMMSPDSTLALDRIGQIAINVHDLARATTFYRDVLGMRFLFEVPKMAFFDCGGIRLMLGAAEEPRFDHPASIIYYAVPDIRAAAETLKARGVSFESEPHEVADLGDRVLWLGFFGDPEGNVLGLMSEVLKEG
jgi:methylmalonyl-CoA/ethylmalonyl-CoA epimerase